MTAGYDPEVVDTRELAVDELSSYQVLSPDDLLQDVGPMAQLLFLGQTGWTVFMNWTAMLSDERGGVVEDDTEPVRAHRALSEAVGNLSAAMALVGLAPPEMAGVRAAADEAETGADGAP